MSSSVSSKHAFFAGWSHDIKASQLVSRVTLWRLMQCIKCSGSVIYSFENLACSSRSEDDDEDLEDILGGDSGNP